MYYDKFRHARRASTSSSSQSCRRHQGGSSPGPGPSSRLSCSGLTAAETRALWQCMLALQLRYGCYKSTRIDLAVLAAGDDRVGLMPNRFIDTLNHSVADVLPAEGRRMLDLCLLVAGPSPSPSAAPAAATSPTKRRPSFIRLWSRR